MRPKEAGRLMINKQDISTLEDIKVLVDSFYSLVKVDDILGPIFNGVIQNNWPTHLDKMYRFWQTVLLEEHTYNGGPFPPHAKLPINQAHFDRWLSLWSSVVENNFTGPKATEAKWRAEKMAVLFLSKINYYQNSSSIPLI